VLIEVDDPEASGRYRAHHNQTYASVNITSEPLWDLDAASAETIDSLK
jgi:hypothetical protein